MVNEVVSGVGANASRTDKNLTARVQRVVNDAKIQNASGGAYTDRSNLTNLAQGASTEVASAMPVASMGQPASMPVQTTNVFAPGSQDKPLSDGAKGGPGSNTSTQIPVDAPNQDSILVRTLAQLNPQSRQLLMMVEAFNEMES
jgi:hypothetical protein